MALCPRLAAAYEPPSDLGHRALHVARGQRGCDAARCDRGGAEEYLVGAARAACRKHRRQFGRHRAAGANAPLVRLPLDSSHATAPRLGPGYLLYVNTEGGSSGLWKLMQGTISSVWSDARLEWLAPRQSRPTGGTSPSSLKTTVTLSCASCVMMALNAGCYSADWSCAAHQRGPGREIDSVCGRAERLAAFVQHPAGWQRTGSTDIRVFSGPSWSPDAKFLVYSSSDVGTTFALRAAAADGRAFPMRSLVLTRGARRVVFFRDSHTLLVLRGTIEHKDFWLVDLDSGAERQLSVLPENFTIGDFDLAPDGRSIVFDRVQANSDLVLIDRAR